MPGTVLPENPKLAQIADIQIDSSGRFKYILCKVYDSNDPQQAKHIIRGTARAEWHSDIYDELDASLEDKGVVCECEGGGKMRHNPEAKSIEVFGESQGYGQANHSMTVDILKKKYADYTSITCTEG